MEPDTRGSRGPDLLSQIDDPSDLTASARPGLARDIPTPDAAPWQTRPARRTAFVFLVAFAALTALMTWPLPIRAAGAVQDLGDPLYEIWTMRWAQHQLVRDPSRLWDGNMAYPFPMSLLFSEPRLSTSILAWPVQAASGNDVLTYNVMLLATFIAVGVGMALLVTEITGIAGAGVLAGVLAAYTPYRYGHLSHLNLLSYGWLPLALWALTHYARARRPYQAVMAALFLTLQVLASDTIAVMAVGMTALLIPILIWEQRHRLSAGFLVGLVLSLAIPLITWAPVVAARFEVNQLYGFTRDLATIREMSATPRSYISISPGNHLWSSTLPVAYPNPLFPGLTTVAGALAGLVFAARRWPRWTLYFALLGIIGFVLSLGPETRVGQQTVTLPYRWLYEHVPGAGAMRDVARLGMVALLAIQGMAGIGIAATWIATRHRIPVRWQWRAGALVLSALTIFALAEFRNDVGIVEVPRDPDTVAVYDWLAAQPPGPVFELPANGLWNGTGSTIHQIYYSTRHWHPIVAGYTSFLPDRHVEFLVGFHGGTEQPSLIDAGNIGLLQDIGVRYVIIHHTDAPGYRWKRAVRSADQLAGLRRIGEFGQATVYRVEPSEREPVRFSLFAPDTTTVGSPLPAVLAIDNDNPNKAVASLDRPPAATATWMDGDGNVVLSARLPVQFPAVVEPGRTLQVITVPLPGTPGNYHLRLTYGDLASPLDTMVEVRPPVVPATSGPAVALRDISWPKRTYRPGDTVEVTTRWEVRRPLATDCKITVQILSPDNRVAGQFDAWPLFGSLQTSDWRPGMVITHPVTVRISERAAPGSASVLVALYDPEDPEGSRLPILLADGSQATEARAGTLEIARP